MKRPNLAIVAMLFTMAAVILNERIHTFNEPIERDIAGYAVIAHEMMAGRQLYSDLWERKPPLLYATFAVAEKVAGYGQGEIFLLNIIAAVGTLLCLYAAGNAGPTPSRIAGITAGGLWALLCFDLPTQANQPNSEVLVNLCLSGAFALMLGRWKKRTICWAIGLGTLLSAATLYKHQSAATCGMLLVAFLLIPQVSTLRLRMLDTLLAGSVILLSWLGVLAYFAATNRFGLVVEILVSQNLQYSNGSLVQNLSQGFDRSLLISPLFAFAWGPSILIAGWALVSRGVQPVSTNTATSPKWPLMIAWLVGTWISIWLPGWANPHYFQMLLPVLSVAGGWAVAELARPNRLVPALFRYALIFGSFLLVLIRQLAPLSISPEQWTLLKYPQDNFSEEVRLGRYLNSHLAQSETFWNLGQDTTLYFVARRPPPTGLLYLDPLCFGPKKDDYQHRLLKDLTHTKPAMVIVSRRWAPYLAKDFALQEWMKEYYLPLPPNPEFPGYDLLQRR